MRGCIRLIARWNRLLRVSEDWRRFPVDPQIAQWAMAADKVATSVLQDPAHVGQYRYQNTWFVGVDALPNKPDGSIAGVPLKGAVIDHLGHSHWHQAQLSVTFPHYPRPADGESAGQHAFRKNRDAAHVDGLLPHGARRRRHLIEPHAFILGLPLNDIAHSPLVVWQGSAAIMRAAFDRALSPYDPESWAQIDLTEIYQSARKRCFEQCARVALPAKPGEALLINRLTLHGVAPWDDSAPCPQGRRIAYFRPELEDVAQWIDAG